MPRYVLIPTFTVFHLSHLLSNYLMMHTAIGFTGFRTAFPSPAFPNRAIADGFAGRYRSESRLNTYRFRRSPHVPPLHYLPQLPGRRVRPARLGLVCIVASFVIGGAHFAHRFNAPNAGPSVAPNAAPVPARTADPASVQGAVQTAQVAGNWKLNLIARLK